MEGVTRRHRVITQPVDDREPVAGWQDTPYQSFTAIPPDVSNEVDISIRKTVHSDQLITIEEDVLLQASTASYSSSDEDGMVVDMQQNSQLHKGFKIRIPGVSERDLSIIVRDERSTCRVVEDLEDLQVVEEYSNLQEKPKGFVSVGNDSDILELLKNRPTQKGVICNNKVLQCEEGFYAEGLQYKVIPGTVSKGAFGEAAMCQDLKTGKCFIRKKVHDKFSGNEVQVPLMFRSNMGIPEVYGVIVQNEMTEVFQEFAGLSLKKVGESEYSEQLRDPKMLLVLAFQAFATLDKLHSSGVTHQDIKPENICLDIQEKMWRLKFIDFGSSQTPSDQNTEGLTNEYLSPESCTAILQVAMGKLPREAGRLGPGTDVWAMALTLLYCLCGYHVMVYVCTREMTYRETDPKKLQQKRIECLFKISTLTDEMVASELIHSKWPDALKMLLVNTLRVNPKDRWSAKQAAYYILGILKGASASGEPKSPASVTPSCDVSGLQSRQLVFRAQPQAIQDTSQSFQISHEVVAEQNTSPMEVAPVSSTRLPAFKDLLSNDLSKKAPRQYKRKQQDCPYSHPDGRGGKVMKN